MGHLKPTNIKCFFLKIEERKVFGYPTIKKSKTLPHEKTQMKLQSDFLENLSINHHS
jgi:hypothetical protein